MACKEAGKPEPLFEATSSEVAVTFYTPISEPFVDSVVDNVVGNEIHRMILKLMTEQPTISARKIGEQIGMTTRGVQKNIEAMKKIGLIEHVGATKSGHWVVRSS